jgi:hypothetical protein
VTGAEVSYIRLDLCFDTVGVDPSKQERAQLICRARAKLPTLFTPPEFEVVLLLTELHMYSNKESTILGAYAPTYVVGSV